MNHWEEKQKERMDFTGLLTQYASKGRNRFNLIKKHTIIESDNYYPLELLELFKIAEREGIPLVYKKAKKPEIYQIYEGLEECRKGVMKYKECIFIE